MPPDPASRPSTPAGTPEAAHAALDAALAPGSEAALPAAIHLATLHDELRASGLVLHVGRRPNPMPAFTAAMRQLEEDVEADRPRADAEFGRQLYRDEPPKSVAAATAATVPSVSERRSRGGTMPGWWGEQPAEGTRRKLIGDVLRVEDVLSESEIREFADAIELALNEEGFEAFAFTPGRSPAAHALADECDPLPDGVHEALAGDRKLTVGTLVDVYDALDRLDAPPAPTPAARIDALYRELRPADPSEVEAELVKAQRQLVDVHNELDRVSIPRAIDADVLDLTERVQTLVRRYLGHRTTVDALTGKPREGELRVVLEHVNAHVAEPPEYRFVEVEDSDGRGVRLPTVRSETRPFVEVVIPAPAEGLVLSAQGLLTAAQRLPEEQYRLLERALAWDVETLSAVPEEDELKPESIALTERSGRRVAKALETLTVTVGGALRVLLDTEGMSQPVTVPRSALALVIAAHDHGAHTVDGEVLRDARDVLRTLLDRTATDGEAR